MNLSGELLDAIRQAAGTFNQDAVSITVCNVDSVDMASLTITCTPTSGDSDASLPDIQLMAEPNKLGFILIPAVGSTVLIASSTRNIPYVAMHSDVDQILMIPNTSIQMFDGSYGGVAKIESLTTKLNNLENLVNDLVTKYNTHTHAGVTSGASTTAIPSAIETGTLTPTQRADIENTKITHGV